MTFIEMMKTGELYDCSMEALPKELEKKLFACKALLYDFNMSRPNKVQHREKLLRKLFAETGTENIVCAQPFGCLPNHIAGKGAVRTVKELYPRANIVPVDYDPSATRVNQENRIKLMLATARENLE